MTRKDSTNVGFSLLLLSVALVAISFLGREVFSQQLPYCDGTRVTGTAPCPNSDLAFGKCDNPNVQRLPGREGCASSTTRNLSQGAGGCKSPTD